MFVAHIGLLFGPGKWLDEYSLLAKPDDLKFGLQILMAEGESQLSQIVFWSPPPLIHKINN